MVIIKDMINENKIGVIITLALLILGSIAYFGFGFSKKNTMNVDMKNINPEIYNDMKIKTAYTPEGMIKIFVNSKEFKYIDVKALDGEKNALSNKIVIGFDEARMMKDEKLFSDIGNKIDGLFGVDIIIGGVLEKTNSPIDDIHFLSEETFEKINGDENKLFVKLKEREPKLFLTYEIEDKNKIKFDLIEGNIENYKVTSIDGKEYLPLIIGYKEAKMMKDEKLFSKPGDKINGLFGNDFVIIGVIKETNTSIDMMHLTTFKKEEMPN